MPQKQLADARDIVMSNAGLPGSGSEMGDAASVLEAIFQTYDSYHHPNTGWPAPHDEQHQLVLFTRKAIGLDWTRTATYYIDGHNERPINPTISARWRNPTVFMVPHGAPRSMQQALDEVFAGGSCFDFSNPGPALCPSCHAFREIDCTWKFKQWTHLNAPDRLYFASAAVDHEADSGFPPVASASIVMAIEYTLVSVVYLVSGGNHFVTQVRLQGEWLKYDSMQSGKQVMYVYLRTALVIPLWREDRIDTTSTPALQYRSVVFLRAAAEEADMEMTPASQYRSVVFIRAAEQVEDI